MIGIESSPLFDTLHLLLITRTPPIVHAPDSELHPQNLNLFRSCDLTELGKTLIKFSLIGSDFDLQITFKAVFRIPYLQGLGWVEVLQPHVRLRSSTFGVPDQKWEKIRVRNLRAKFLLSQIWAQTCI